MNDIWYTTIYVYKNFFKVCECVCVKFIMSTGNKQIFIINFQFSLRVSYFNTAPTTHTHKHTGTRPHKEKSKNLGYTRVLPRAGGHRKFPWRLQGMSSSGWKIAYAPTLRDNN